MNGGQVTLSNSIVSGNFTSASSTNDQDIGMGAGGLIYSSSNLVQFVARYSTNGPSGPAPLAAAPLLAPLGYYGGPIQTMLPLPNSPAIDNGVANSLSTDQRGYARLIGPAQDLGAVEFQDASPIVVTNADSGAGSLRFAATYTTNGQFITFDGSLSGATIRLTSGQILLIPAMTIDGSSLPGGIKIDGNNNSRIFQLNNGSTAVLNSLIITNGNGTGGGNSAMGGGVVYPSDWLII